MTCIIRAYAPAVDRAQLIRLIRTELVPLSHTVSPLDARELRRLPQRLLSGSTLVACRGRGSAASGFVHAVAARGTLLIDMLAVHPRHRGTGWGRRLMERAEAYGIRRRCSLARLYVDEGNMSALRFYTRLGYALTGYAADYRCHEMTKQLLGPAMRS
ncbi:GNAT family N-acetyltransferase [Paenibacillus sp. IB182496]|uniref:GNAT family N-acetyltransferase n=1 Tax=Paenibacillus sabuli TaxID=2772509 RepID=A0A927BPA5_9BACL|nr:GNAT family N-acetyltransferase [Paenibacillus sabuli]MBD2844228.1 GNAT family N-acetyltransferase [Paenibacillus sabuli]